MNCNAVSPRLTVVKQTYGRPKNQRKSPHVNPSPRSISSTPKDSPSKPDPVFSPNNGVPVVVPKIEPVESPVVVPPKTPPFARSIAPRSPNRDKSRPSPSLQAGQCKGVSQLATKQTTLLQFSSPKSTKSPGANSPKLIISKSQNQLLQNSPKLTNSKSQELSNSQTPLRSNSQGETSSDLQASKSQCSDLPGHKPVIVMASQCQPPRLKASSSTTKLQGTPSSTTKPTPPSTTKSTLKQTQPQKPKASPDNHKPSGSRLSLPKKLLITPPPSRPVPNILRRTPIKNTGASPHRPTTPKSKSVNLSPVLYSPTLKKKNPFISTAGENQLPTRAHIIASVVNYSPRKVSGPSPKKNNISSQFNIVRTVKPASLENKCSGGSQKSPAKSSEKKILCNVDMRTEDAILVSYCVNGKIFSGMLLSNCIGSGLPGSSNSGYLADQLPSQYHKKLKNKLGLSLDSGCDSETSDSETVKHKLKKLRYSDYKSMKDSLTGESSETKNNNQSSVKPRTDHATVTQVASSRPNLPFANTSKHDKKSVNGLANFLTEATEAAFIKAVPEVTPVRPISKETPDSGKGKSGKTSASKSKDQSKTAKPAQCKASDPPSSKKLKSAQTVIVAQLVSDTPITKAPKTKFGEKFIKKAIPTKPSTSADSTPPKTPPISRAPDPEAPIHNKLMRSKSHSADDKAALSSLLRENSAQLVYLDLEWPAWCPRKLKLQVVPAKKGGPASCKVTRSGSKRRRSESNASTESEVAREEKFVEMNNPFGIGDVIMAKRTQCPGRPYWPGKVLSVTGLTVCVLFYNTSEVMQIAKCNVEWYYDGCLDHKISYVPSRDSLDWKEALEGAERDVKRCIGETSVVWGRYEGDWWPARVVEAPSDTPSEAPSDAHDKYTVLWMDDSSMETLPLSALSPFLLAYNTCYSERMRAEYDNYTEVVERSTRIALHQVLVRASELEEEEQT